MASHDAHLGVKRSTQSKQAHSVHVLIHGFVLFYDSKAPYAQSGKSIFGALEYDKEDDRIRCHECGDYFQHLGNHVANGHGLKASEYKRKHGLRQTAALVCESLRNAYIRNTQARIDSGDIKPFRSGETPRRKSCGETRSHGEIQNRRGTCTAQTLERLQALVKRLGRVPTRPEINSNGLNCSTLQHHFGSVAKALKLAGFHQRSTGTRPSDWNRKSLLSILADFISANKRIPSWSDFKRGLLPSPAAYYRHFGGYTEAIRELGFVPRPKNFPRTRKTVPVVHSAHAPQGVSL